MENTKWENFDWDSIDINEQLDILEQSKTFTFTQKSLKATLTPEFKSFCDFYEIRCSHHYNEFLMEHRDSFVGRALPIFLLENNGWENNITMHNADVALNGKYTDYPETKFSFAVIEDDYYSNMIDEIYKTPKDLVEEIGINIINDFDNLKRILEHYHLYPQQDIYEYGLTSIPADHINDLIGDLLDKKMGESITYKPVKKEMDKEIIRHISIFMTDTIAYSKLDYRDKENFDMARLDMQEEIEQNLLKAYKNLENLEFQEQNSKPKKQR